jgi:predicted membrane protein
VEAAQDLPRQVINVMGETRIDLSGAPPGVYELRVCNVMGELQVAVPCGTEVSRTLWNLLSDVSLRPWKSKRRRRREQGERAAGVRVTRHRVTLSGFSLMGEVTIREEPA